ncbi:hypothetical protein Zmor_016033 [Zophobas morio]|uniref:Odorant receptor n=1 Tax=Zophobas morio TaxID=2755281 RepID=A0AA38IN70_9CUCU|nr:hypothetical protein Zmor_016033 [Zophobas morio]
MAETDRNNVNTDFEISDYPKNDCLKLARFFCFDIFEITLIKILVVATVYVILLITLAQTYSLLHNFDLKYFNQHAPTYFVLQFVIVSCCGVLFKGPKCLEKLKELRMFVPKDKKDEIFKKMEREARLVNFGVITLLLLGSFSGFVILVPSEKDQDTYFIYDLIKDFMLPSWKIQVSLMCCIGCAFFTYVTVANFCQFIYCSFHIKRQRELTVNCIRKIHALCESRACNCEQHQEEIKETLKFVILYQNDIIACGYYVIKQAWPVILSHSVFAGLFFISMLFLVLTVEHTFILYARIVPIIVSSTLTGISVITLGQHLQDSTVECFNELCTLNWYNWNEENKKIYLIMLSNQMVPFKIKLTENIAINYSLGFVLCKTVYSVVSVLVHMRNAKYN